MDASNDILTFAERRNRLIMHLGRLRLTGAQIEEHDGCRAIVRARVGTNVLPNVLMLVAGIALWAFAGGVIFLLAALVAALGWHRKAQLAAATRRILVRVDEMGHISECELESSSV